MNQIPITKQQRLTNISAKMACLLILLFILWGGVSARAGMDKGQQQQMLDMLNQLDQLDQMDFDEAIFKAQSCIIRRDYQCAKKQLALAKTYAHNPENNQRITESFKNLRAEQEKQEQEEEELRELAEERKRLREEQEEAQHRYARQMEDNDSSFDLNQSIYNSINQMGQDIQQFQQKLDADTNAAIRRTNEMLAAQHRQREAQARQQQLARIRQQQQQEYEQQRRARQIRAAELERQQRQRQEELARKKQELAAERQRQQEARAAQRQKEQEERLAAKRRQKEEEEAKYRKFYSAMKNGAKLHAKNCYGETHVLGSLPSKSGYGVFSTLVNIHFRASCPGGHPSVTGVLNNMVSMGTGCYGDTVQIDLPCKPESINVVVTDATGD